MSATYTFDVFSSLDGFGAASGNWAGYWGKQGLELLSHRLGLYREDQRMVFGANTYRAFERMLSSSTDDSEVRDPWVTRMTSLPATVVSTTLEGPLDWPDATLVSGDAVDVVARLKDKSEVPLRSHGSLAMNRALMAAGLVDIVQVTLFPVITGQTGMDPIFQGAADFDLELIEHERSTGTSKSSPTAPLCMSEPMPRPIPPDPTRRPSPDGWQVGHRGCICAVEHHRERDDPQQADDQSDEVGVGMKRATPRSSASHPSQRGSNDPVSRSPAAPSIITPNAALKGTQALASRAFKACNAVGETFWAHLAGSIKDEPDLGRLSRTTAPRGEMDGRYRLPSV